MNTVVRTTIMAAMTFVVFIAFYGCSQTDEISNPEKSSKDPDESEETLEDSAGDNEEYPEDDKYFLENYIGTYVEPTSVSVYSGGFGETYLEIDGKSIQGSDNEEFMALAEKYNDLYYDKYSSSRLSALYDGLCGITVLANDYYNADHPEGSDISDIVSCRYVSFYDFVRSGYSDIDTDKSDESFQYLMEYRYEDGARLFECSLSDLNYENTLMMAPEMVLEFDANPEESGTHKFSLTFKMPEIELETDFEHEF